MKRSTLFALAASAALACMNHQTEEFLAIEETASVNSRASRGTPTVIDFDQYRMTINGAGTVAALTLPSEEYDKWNAADAGFNNRDDRNSVANLLYSQFKDDFDFIFFINNETEKAAALGYYGQLIQISNNVTGIGLSQFDYSAESGSEGRLQSVIHLPYRCAIQSGPTLHELMHNWANFMKSFEMASPNGNYNSIPHWGWSSVGGQLGGFAKETLVDLGNNLYQANSGRAGSTSFGGFANGGNSIPYSPWEMYLAGFWPVDSLEDITWFKGVSTDAELYSEGKFYADSLFTYSVNDFLGEQGTRTPESSTSQREFSMLAVVLTPTDLTDTEWAEVESQVNWLVYPGEDQSYLFNFYEGTHGEATLKSEQLTGSLKSGVAVVHQPVKETTPIVHAVVGKQLRFNSAVHNVSIVSPAGRILVQRQELNSNESLDLSSLARGTYLLNYRFDGRELSQTIQW